MQGFYHFHKVPTVTVGEAASKYHVRVITDIAAFQTEHGEFRADQLKKVGHQLVPEAEKFTHYFLKEAVEGALTLAQLEGLAITLVPHVKKS